MEPLSIAGLFAAGVLTFASPCVLPLVPLYLSFISGASVAELRGGAGKSGAVLRAGIAFAIGLSVVFVALGLLAGVAGASIAAYRDRWMPIAGALLLVFGLKLLGVVSIPLLDRDVRPGLSRVKKGGGLLGAFGLGAAFGLGWTPCVGPVLGTALSFAATASSSPWTAGSYLAVYAAGLSAPLIAVAAFGSTAFRWMDRVKPHLGKLEKVTGLAVAVVAVLMLTGTLFNGFSFTDESAPFSPMEEVATPVASAEPVTAVAVSEPAVTEVQACGATSDGAPCALPEADTVAAHTDAGNQPPVTPWVHDGARVLAFESKHCPVCERMKAVVASAEKSCSAAGAPFQRVDVGTSSGNAQARSRGVLGVPTYVFLDPVGQEVARLIGEQPLERVLSSVAAAAGRPCGT